jgi:hypothetical protein
MKRNQARNIIIHNSNSSSLPGIINEFHIQVIERRLNRLSLSSEQKITVIDKIIENLKSREINGIIK